MDCRENAQAIVDLFNELFEADPGAASLLFSTRVPCNDAVADHRSIVVAGEPGNWKVGVMGLINALFGEAHRVGICLGDDGRCVGFTVVDVSRKQNEERGSTMPPVGEGGTRMSDSRQKHKKQKAMLLLDQIEEAVARCRVRVEECEDDGSIESLMTTAAVDFHLYADMIRVNAEHEMGWG